MHNSTVNLMKDRGLIQALFKDYTTFLPLSPWNLLSFFSTRNFRQFVYLSRRAILGFAPRRVSEERLLLLPIAAQLNSLSGDILAREISQHPFESEGV